MEIDANKGKNLALETSISVIILTHNEQLHIERCIKSLLPIASEIFVIDSFSTDQTTSIAEQLGAKVFQNAWKNYATQFQWALDNCPIQTDWVMRMDADEYITDALAEEIQQQLPQLARSTGGILLKRRVYFMDRWIRYGGYYPTKLLRIWRNGKGRIEQRWMDEHIVLSSGEMVEFKHDIVDYNLQNLSWWTTKHNQYASREAVDLLNKKHHFFQEDHSIKSSRQQSQRKRWAKDNLYAQSPLFLRAIVYFFFRYFLQLGFLDGKAGLIWHGLQGLWYRFLVDAKIAQIQFLARQEGKTIKAVIEQHFGIALDDVNQLKKP